MEVEARRSGPRSDLDVPTAVLDAAERLFAGLGVEGVSLRQVAREAGVAPTAVVYHFQDKDGVITAVLARRGRAVVRSTRATLKALIAAPGAPTPRALVTALTTPYVDLLAADPPGGLAWVKVVYGLATTHHPVWAAAMDRDPELIPLARMAFARAFPELPAAERDTLGGLTVFATMGVLAGTGQPGFGTPLDDHGLDPAFVDTLISFASAGLRGAAHR